MRILDSCLTSSSGETPEFPLDKAPVRILGTCLTNSSSENHGLSLDEFIAKAGQRLPMKRMGRAEEAADLALFLASERASYLTGCAINMDGGLSKAV